MKKWNEISYWLRGGYIAMTLGLLLAAAGILLITLGMYFDCPSGGEGVCRNGVITLIGVIIFILPAWIFRAFDIPIIFEFILYLAQFFIIGAIVGWVYNKMKNRPKIIKNKVKK